MASYNSEISTTWPILKIFDFKKHIQLNWAFSEGLKNMTVKLTKFVTAEHFITHRLVMYTLIDAELHKISDALD